VLLRFLCPAFVTLPSSERLKKNNIGPILYTADRFAEILVTSNRWCGFIDSNMNSRERSIIKQIRYR